MKKKKIVSIVMCLVLGIAVFIPGEANAEASVATTSTDSNVLYDDSFEGTALEVVWTASGNGQVSSGTMNGVDGKSFYAYLSGVEGASEWADYSVEADVTITSADSNEKAIVGIAARASETSWYGGYIMKLNYADQKAYIYSAKSDGTNGLVSLVSTSMSIALNTTYQLKLVAVDDKIAGYVDGTKILEYTADTETMTEKSAKKNDAGYPGVLVNNGTVTIDNFVVTESYSLYSDSFEGTAIEDVWTASGNGQVSSGTMNGVDGKSFYAYLSGVESASKWTDYSVEADVTITSLDSSKATVGIAIRSSEASWYGGYIMKLNYADQKAYLYSKKSDESNSLIALVSVAQAVELNKTYSMKLLVVGERILGYVDNQIVFEYTASADNMTAKSAKKNDAGYPGVLVNNGVATIDNFTVNKMQDNSFIVGKTDDSATVYIDGKQSAEAKETGIVQANPGQSVQIISDTENTVYLVKEDGTVEQPEMLQNAIGYVGTAIRTTGNTGLRFKSSITNTAKAGSEEYTLLEYGTVVTKESILNSDNLYLNASYVTVKGVAYEKDNKDLIFEQKDDVVHFTGVLINIAEANYNTSYVARTYVIYEDADGIQYEIYGAEISRSLYEIAVLAYNDTEYGYTTDEKAYFKEIIDVVGGQ